MKIVDEDSYFGTYLNKYYKIGIQSVDDRTYGGKTLKLTMESMRKDSNEPRTVRVLKEPGLYNILTKDYKFGTDSKKVTITSSS